ncbi:NAD(P)-binding domain-containing protein [Catelliglobosispora koreensis]|uniref:NAD(P)-binding domain-containing protein n=1 Tax=Catelliglobosispora koreensis TaxID=129052 RepID=UPI0003807E40|nr:NAD(P)-binding domain-containing protein [Catelliglobosispora koreensis]
MSTTPVDTLPVVVIGAGPVGLAAAAQLATRNVPFVIVEAGEQIAASIREWAHVRLFSPWRYNTDPAARALLEPTGWTAPDPAWLPTGGELINDYLEPLAAHPAIAPNLKLGVKVEAIARQGFDKVRTAGRDAAPFLIRLSDGSELLARAIVDASGTWRSPNPLGGNGLAAHGETGAVAAGRVFAGMPDAAGTLREKFEGKTVAVVGAGHSATGTLLALAELPGTQVHWLLRSADPSRSYGGGAADALPARGSIGTRVKDLVDSGKVTVHTGFFIHEITADGLVSADGRTVGAQVIVNSTGARPDYSASTELRLDLDPILGSTRALAPLIDPNQHSCGTVPPHGYLELGHPEDGFYVVGAKSYGRAPTFLLATGFEQARSVVAALAGDLQAAAAVELDLPETGVCSTNNVNAAPAAAEESGCCGTPAPAADAKRGLATGVAGGLLTVPLVTVGAPAEQTGGGCGSSCG